MDNTNMKIARSFMYPDSWILFNFLSGTEKRFKINFPRLIATADDVLLNAAERNFIQQNLPL